MKLSKKFFAMILVAIMCLGTVAPVPITPTLVQAKAKAPSSEAIHYVLDNGLMSVDAKGAFNPDAVVSGRDFAKSLRVLDSKFSAKLTKAPLTRELAVSTLRAYAKEKGIKANIAKVIGGQKRNPKSVLTRKQAAEMLMRYCTKIGSYPIQSLVGQSVDYSKSDNWLRVPKVTKAVDTVYIYPTVFIDASPDVPRIAPIDNASMRAGAEKMYQDQATAFEKYTNVFAPYYRQSNLIAITGKAGAELEAFQMQEQRTDIYGVLDYYFKHYNQGRPFIIAGHSQGSIMTKIVLGEYMQQHPEYYKRMVAAYIIGFSVTKDFLTEHPYLKFAKGADDTGVIVSWNTEGSGNKGQFNMVVSDGALAINPINWKRDNTYAPVEENLGSLVMNRETGKYEMTNGVADAQVDLERGVVICTTGRPFIAQTDFFGPASYHANDYDFYYVNIQENVGDRVKSFLKSIGRR
ncbi:MAG: DUF3089 domain-containing protein [Lachnospiraceae bacterium]|nr:DUF3089 domain-containing protein [Lachnospiraceae bacterium]